MADPHSVTLAIEVGWARHCKYLASYSLPPPLLPCSPLCSQAISQVRTVYSFVAEELTLVKYVRALEATLKLGIKASLTKGLGIGGVLGVIFCSWALQLWYASTLIASGAATGGATITTMFAVLIAGM